MTKGARGNVSYRVSPQKRRVTKSGQQPQRVGRDDLNDVRFNYGFTVQFVPVLRSFLQHCIQVRLIWRRPRLRLRFLPQNAGQYDDWFSGDLVVKSRDYGVVASKALAWNLPLKRPDPLRSSCPIYHLAN